MKNKIVKPLIHRLRNNSGSMIITIPAEICHKYNFQVGDKFEISVINENELNIRRIIH